MRWRERDFCESENRGKWRARERENHCLKVRRRSGNDWHSLAGEAITKRFERDRSTLHRATFAASFSRIVIREKKRRRDCATRGTRRVHGRCVSRRTHACQDHPATGGGPRQAEAYEIALRNSRDTHVFRDNTSARYPVAELVNSS